MEETFSRDENNSSDNSNKTPNLSRLPNLPHLPSQEIQTDRCQSSGMKKKKSQTFDWLSRYTRQLSNPRSWWRSPQLSPSHAKWQTVAQRNRELGVSHRFPKQALGGESRLLITESAPWHKDAHSSGASTGVMGPAVSSNSAVLFQWGCVCLEDPTHLWHTSLLKGWLPHNDHFSKWLF